MKNLITHLWLFIEFYGKIKYTKIIEKTKGALYHEKHCKGARGPSLGWAAWLITDDAAATFDAALLLAYHQNGGRGLGVSAWVFVWYWGRYL